MVLSRGCGYLLGERNKAMNMSFLRSSEPDSTRSASEGRCFLYVLPCRDEDLVKLGFSRNPLARMETLHPRYFDLFDIDRGLLIETDTVREARRLELELAHAMALHSAPQPLLIRERAGGATEWYRGADAGLQDMASALEREGFIVHRPLRPWIRSQLSNRCGDLFSWGEAVLSSVEGEPAQLDVSAYRPLRADVLAVLDAFSALGIALSPLLPETLMTWYRGAYRSTHLQSLPGEDDDASGQTA